MVIIGFNGSPRKTGNTAAIMKQMLKGATDAGAETHYVHLKSYQIAGCIGCEQCRKDKTCTQFYDGMHLLYPLIEEADGIILGSPAYNYNVTPWMKAFIDRLYPFFTFPAERPGPYTSCLADRGKRALVFGVCAQLDPREAGYTVFSMHDAIEALGYIMADPITFAGHFAVGSASHSPETLKRAYTASSVFIH